MDEGGESTVFLWIMCYLYIYVQNPLYLITKNVHALCIQVYNELLHPEKGSYVEDAL